MRTIATLRVGVVDPVDRDLVDAQAAALGEDQQLGVEEPGLVLDRAAAAPVTASARDRLEAALGVGEAGCAGSRWRRRL